MTDGRNDESAAPAVNAIPAAAPTPGDGQPQGWGEWWRLRRVGVWVLAALVLALIAVGSLPYWAPPLVARLPWGAGPQHAQQIATLQARLEKSEQDRTAAQAELVQNQPAPAPAPPAAAPPAATPASAAPVDAALADRIAALEHRPAVADDTAALAPIHQQLGQLAARLDAIETRLAKLTSDVAARRGDADRMLLVAVATLRGTVASSRPYAGELAAVAALAGDRPELAAALKPLAATAASGIPSIAALDERFTNDTAPAILRAAAAAPKDESWGAAILARLEGLVVIRRIDGAGGASGGASDPAATAVARAQQMLDKGDLAGAGAALATLEGPAAQAAAPWLASARQRLAAETALDDVTQRIAAHLAQASQATPAAAESH